MKITKGELNSLIRECLREALNEAAVSGGQAEGGFLDTAKRPGGSTAGSGTNFKATEGKKTKKVLAKDIKPGMITDTGKVLTVKDAGWVNGEPSVEIGYGNIGKRGSYASDCVSKDHEYEVLDESFEEDTTNMNWEDLVAAADRLLDELVTKTGNASYDDGDGYWAEEEGHVWCNRYLYYTDKLNSSSTLEAVCAEYSQKLPNVEFYYVEDDFEDEPVSEIGYYATNVDYVAIDESVDTEEAEDLLEGLFEGIFDSKEKKQKAYAQIISDAFNKAPAAVAAEIASKAVDAIEETNDCLGDDNASTTKAAAKNFISAMTSAKAGAQKSPYGMLNSIISYVQKYNREAVDLEDLVEFKRAAIKVQNAEKDGKKAMDYLLDLVNNQMSMRIDRTIAYLKKEYSV